MAEPGLPTLTPGGNDPSRHVSGAHVGVSNETLLLALRGDASGEACWGPRTPSRKPRLRCPGNPLGEAGQRPPGRMMAEPMLVWPELCESNPPRRFN